MNKIPIRYVENKVISNQLMPYRERRSGIEDKRYEVDISKLPRPLLQLAAAYLDEDAWIRLKKQTTADHLVPSMDASRNWLAYYADILRFQDLDSFAQSSKIRKQWFETKETMLPLIAEGSLPLNQERTSEENWHQFMSIAEDAATRPDAPPPGYASVLILLGTEWENSGKLTQRVVCGIPACMHLETGQLAPSKEPLILNTKHLSSEDRDARIPRIGALQPQTDSVEPNNVQSDDDQTVMPTWQTHWIKVNASFMQFQDQNPKQPITAFSWKSGFGQKQLSFLGVSPYTAVPAANRRLIALTEDIQHSTEIPQLLKNVIEADARQPLAKPCITWNSSESSTCRAYHMGHMGGEFGLDETQRKALWQTIDVSDGNYIGVSGPPGTGKTSMLQGVIGTLVVQAALRQTPVVIVAASHTNQATTNMINAFGSIAKCYEEGQPLCIEHRWIDGFASYGWYFPSATKRKNAGSTYQELFREKLFEPSLQAGGTAKTAEGGEPCITYVTQELMAIHRKIFHARFKQYLQQKNEWDLFATTSPTAYLHKRLKDLVGDNSDIRRALRVTEEIAGTLKLATRASLLDAEIQYTKLSHRTPIKDKSHHLAQLHEQVQKTYSVIDRAKAHYFELANPTNSIRSRISRLIAVLTRQPQDNAYHDLRRDLLEVHRALMIPEDQHAFISCANQIIETLCLQADKLKAQIGRVQRWQGRRLRILEAIKEKQAQLEPLVNQSAKLRKFLALLTQLFATHRTTECQTSFEAGLRGDHTKSHKLQKPLFQLGLQIDQLINQAGPANPAVLLQLRHALECVVDITVRYEAFHVAMRYWEAKWIEEAVLPLPEDPKQEVRATLERAAMLAPVIVATAQTMPALALYLDLNGLPQHALEVADWFVMDESGQVPPPLAIPLTALARKSLAVGDVNQLEPVVTMDKKNNRDLRRRHHIADLTTTHQTDSLDAVKGNFMACAQFASERHENAAAGSFGVMLKYHYRCRRTIIEFCNRLVYDAIEPLVPMVQDAPSFARTPNEATDDEALLPPMGFVAIEGNQTASDTSQSNQDEISAIIDWLKENRAAIKNRYGSVEKAVAVIAPYGAQVAKLKEGLSAAGFKIRQFNTDDIVNDALVDKENVDEMVVGTVHSLQGAEKEIVLFSTVNDPTGKIFIDRKASMLNVAVSRAKHAFIVFGHPEVILKPSRSFSGILGAYLREFGYRLYPRDLYILESTEKTKLVDQAFGKIAKAIATVGHVREIDLDQNGTPTWRLKANAEKFLDQLNRFVQFGTKHYDHIYLATDDDREGEAIAWHVMELSKRLGRLRSDGRSSAIPVNRFFRLRFYAMSPAALIEGKRYMTRGVDPLRVRAALARAVADKLIADEILEQAKVNAGRVTAALLDEISHLNQQQQKTFFKDTVLLSSEENGEMLEMTRLVNNEPLENAALFDKPTDGSLIEQTEELVAAAVTVQKVGPLLREEASAPATYTAVVLQRVINQLNLTPQEASAALQEIYSGDKQNEAYSEGLESL